MIKTLLFFCSLISIQPDNLKQVSNYSIGKYNTAAYEEFSFWITDKNQPYVTYTFGKDDKELPVKYLGIERIKGKPCIKLKVNNKKIMYVALHGDRLLIFDDELKNPKGFTWRYEGPVNGIGTYCNVCTQDAKQSAAFLKKYYLKD